MRAALTSVTVSVSVSVKSPFPSSPPSSRALDREERRKIGIGTQKAKKKKRGRARGFSFSPKTETRDRRKEAPRPRRPMRPSPRERQRLWKDARHEVTSAAAELAHPHLGHCHVLILASHRRSSESLCRASNGSAISERSRTAEGRGVREMQRIGRRFCSSRQVRSTRHTPQTRLSDFRVIDQSGPV